MEKAALWVARGLNVSGHGVELRKTGKRGWQCLYGVSFGVDGPAKIGWGMLSLARRLHVPQRRIEEADCRS